MKKKINIAVVGLGQIGIYLLNELKIILQAESDSVIIIDDIRCMGNDGYPSLAQILSLVPQGKQIQINHDQLIIV